MAVFVAHEPCPACGSRDNLGRYSDGSAWCFGCHYTERRSRFVGSRPISEQVSSIGDYDVQLPTDLGFDFPRHVVSWLSRYRVSVEDAIRHGWKYSPSRDQLVFLFADAQGKTACTQARNFRPGSRLKYYNQGNPKDVLPISKRSNVHSGGERILVVVEDAISAVRVASAGPLEGSWCHAMPCLGSYLPAKKITRLRASYDTLVVWLDSDKLKEARHIAQMAKWLGMNTRVVHTEEDPKCFSDEEIIQYLN